MDYIEWTKKAQEKIENHIKENETFTLKSLFEPFEWEKLTPAERRSFGKYFSNEAREERIQNVFLIGENSKNRHKKYLKKEKN